MGSHNIYNIYVTYLFSISANSHKIFRSRKLSTESQLVSRILSEYDAHSRPPVRDSADHSAILVITNVFINRIKWQGDQAEVDMYLRQQWEDSRLQYPVDQREGIDEVSLPANQKIWKPDTYFTSGREAEKNPSLQSVVIEPSGYIRSSEQRTVSVPIGHGASFPFLNTRTINLRLASYKYPAEDVIYMWANSPPLVNPVEVSSDLLVGPILFEEASAEDCSGNYSIGTFSCIDVTITFSGSVFGSLCTWFLPSIFLVIASWLHFWVHGSWSVPRTASAALPFMIFAVLFIFRSDVVNSTPSVSCWYSFCLILTFLSFVEYFFVICCGGRRTVRLASVGHPEDHPIGNDRQVSEVVYDTNCVSFRRHNGLDIVSRILFPLLFIIYLIIYFIFLI
ncbi:unnamed protein product [Auanema sp. JU1783]|nr:unnamed protein product [Auanema sp. JU1783]